MMPFHIKLLPTMAPGSEGRNGAQYGEILLGDYTESFEAVIGFWSSRDYEQHWRQGVSRLVRQHKSSCLITSMHDPEAIDILFWWLLYPDNESVVVQHAILVLKDLSRPFDPDQPYDFIPERRTVSNGYEISEWQLPLTEFQDFLTET